MVFSRQDVVLEALKAHPSVTPYGIHHTFAELVQRGEILSVPGDGSASRYVPAETWLQEKPFCAQWQKERTLNAR